MKENVQMISWSIEFATLVVAVLVVVFIWRLSMKASKNRKNRDNS